MRKVPLKPYEDREKNPAFVEALILYRAELTEHYRRIVEAKTDEEFIRAQYEASHFEFELVMECRHQELIDHPERVPEI